ncbi:hypothetical protein LINPERPRIM_LOCUS30650 [Linum perenne]
MFLRRWEKGIKPLDFSAKSTPEWITLRKVPPDVISIEGISWISSMLGKPVKRFVRDGLDVKVCILRDKAVPCPEEIGLEMEEGEICPIAVEQVKAREYGGKKHSVWLPKSSGVQKVVCLNSGNGDKAILVENSPGSSEHPVTEANLNVENGGWLPNSSPNFGQITRQSLNSEKYPSHHWT